MTYTRNSTIHYPRETALRMTVSIEIRTHRSWGWASSTTTTGPTPETQIERSSHWSRIGSVLGQQLNRAVTRTERTRLRNSHVIVCSLIFDERCSSNLNGCREGSCMQESRYDKSWTGGENLKRDVDGTAWQRCLGMLDWRPIVWILSAVVSGVFPPRQVPTSGGRSAVTWICFGIEDKADTWWSLKSRILILDCTRSVKMDRSN
jgi:hypothetical protein